MYRVNDSFYEETADDRTHNEMDFPDIVYPGRVSMPMNRRQPPETNSMYFEELPFANISGYNLNRLFTDGSSASRLGIYIPTSLLLRRPGYLRTSHSDDPNLEMPTAEQLKSMTELQIRLRRVEQSGMENKHETNPNGKACDVEDPVEDTQDDTWECVICKESEWKGQFVVQQGCRHHLCAKCFGRYLRFEWNHDRVSQHQRPKQFRCSYCRRPVRLWARSSRLLTHGSKEKDDLMKEEIQRRLKVMRQGMTWTERTRAEQLLGPIKKYKHLWATDGWFAMYFGHMEEELRIAGFLRPGRGRFDPLIHEECGCADNEL